MSKLDHLPAIARYLRSPVLDLSGGDAFTETSIRARDTTLDPFLQNSVRTIVGYRMQEKTFLERIWGLLSEGGCLIYRDIHPDVLQLLKRIGRHRVLMEDPMWVVQKLKGANGRVVDLKLADPRKKVALLRLGAYGDMIMITPLLDYFRAQDCHITVITQSKGKEILGRDPRIDDLMAIEPGVIPTEVGKFEPFLEEMAKKYDRFINLSGTLEETMLPREGSDPLFFADYDTRQLKCGGKYMDAHFVKAGIPVPLHPNPTVYLHKDELEWGVAEARRLKATLRKSFLVLWNLMGSSFHKMYPWMYDVWSIIEHNRDDIGFVTVSEPLGIVLQDRQFKCVAGRAGKYSIRQTLALHAAVDGVVTPETMSLVAGLGFRAPVIALLSHSSKDQYWWRPGDRALYPTLKDCPCYPCHQIHYSRRSCPRGVYSGDATLCMDSITPKQVYDALVEIRGERSGDDAGAASDQG